MKLLKMIHSFANSTHAEKTSDSCFNIPDFLPQRRCERLRRVNLFYFWDVEEFPLIAVVFSLKEHVSAPRGYFLKTLLRLRSDWLGQKPFHCSTCWFFLALLRTDQFFEMTSDPIPRLKFTSRTAWQFWSGGALSLFNHRPEGHRYSFLLPRQYVFAFVKDG